MTHHTWKPYDFIQLKTGLQRNVQRIHSFNKTASSINDILKPGPEPLPDLRHGVPGEGPHHLLDLRDLGLCLIVKLCSDLQLRNAPRKIVHRAAGRGAGRPDLLLPHLHKVLLEPVLRPLAVVGRVACALCAGLFPCSYLSYSHKICRISRSSTSNKFVEPPFIILNSVLIEVSIAHCFIHGMSGVKSEYYPCSCSSLLINLCRYMSFCYSLDSLERKNQ